MGFLNANESISFLHESNTVINTLYDPLLNREAFQTDLLLNILTFETQHLLRYENTVASDNYSETTKKIVTYENKINYGNESATLILKTTYLRSVKKFQALII